jgi:hypothetical protein
MDDVRLTPAERRALDEIEGELRKDRELDRAMRRMRTPRSGRHLLRRRKTEPPTAGTRGEDAAPGEDHGAPGDAASGAGLVDTADRRRMWALAVVLTVVLSVLLSAGTLYFLVFALVLVTLTATAAVVWMCVSFYLGRPGTS